MSTREFRETYWTQVKDTSPGYIYKDVSVFDPMLCDINYRWFCPYGGIILDPFSGGSVRGIVANVLGYTYIGIDINEKQIEANIEQAEKLGLDQKKLIWTVGDSRNIIPLTKKHYDKVDFIFSCPPYFNLEVYTDKESDISSINNYDEFIESYNLIIFNTVKMLKDRRFAGIVVSNFRDRKTGFYYNFVGDTINAFKKAGMGLYNEVVYQQMAGTASLRAGQVFRATRKFTRTHQSLLLFYKGENPKEGLEQHCFSIRPDGDRLQQFLSKGSGQIDKFLKKSHHKNAEHKIDSNDESESADEAKRALPRGTDSADDESEPENDHKTTNLDPILSSLRPCKVIIQPIGYYSIDEIEESDNEKKQYLLLK